LAAKPQELRCPRHIAQGGTVMLIEGGFAAWRYNEMMRNKDRNGVQGTSPLAFPFTP
jgi:hypothetical protein